MQEYSIAPTGLLVMVSAVAHGQVPLAQEQVTQAIDSGWIANAQSQRAIIFSTTVEESGAPWLRLCFERAELGHAPAGSEPTVLVLTSLLDGAQQRHTASTLQQWQNTSAYFNGDRVRVELFADPGAGLSLLRMSSATAGLSDPAEGGPATICGPEDDRVPSDDPRSGRLLPEGCTAWIIDDANRCLLSAGHCGAGPAAVLEFNVPPSETSGSLIHPGPEDQYAVDGSSVQMANGGIGNDWAYFGCFPNPNTALTPFEAQGNFYALALASPEAAGTSTRITGYGVDDSPPEWNQTQQTADGTYQGVSGSSISYEIDTRGGNSGAAVVDERTGLAIGIHTNGGCAVSGGANFGTAIENAALQGALANPLGVCQPAPPLQFVYPEGLPESLDPSGQTIMVEVLDSEENKLQPGSVQLQYDIGQGLVFVDLEQVDSGLFEAVFPPAECGTEVEFFFRAETTAGTAVTDPSGAPRSTYLVPAVEGFDHVFLDDFETDTGWTVNDSSDLDSGSWERGIPAGFGDRGDPATDADGSGRCYATALADGDTDVDGGTTTLTSPRLDGSEGDAHIAYERWFSNTAGAAPLSDTFLVEISADDGRSWSVLEVVGPDGPEADGGWVFRSFRVADHVPPTDALRVRFVASDLGLASVVEAAIDGFRLSPSANGFVCSSCALSATGCACPADVASPADGEVDVQDLVQVILAWGQSGQGDVNVDGAVDVLDLIEVIVNWGPCP